MRTLALLAAAALCSGAAEFTRYIGDAYDYQVARVVTDAVGNTYIAGNRLVLSPHHPSFESFIDGFVMKLDAAGNTVLFKTLSGTDFVTDLAVDSAGYIFVVGDTNSLNLPLHNALQSTPGQGFIMKLSPDATQAIYSTYYREGIEALAVDTIGNVYVAGTTRNPLTFPTTPGLPTGQGRGSASGAFLTKISAAGDRVMYSTVIAGHINDCGVRDCNKETTGLAVAVDRAGNAYLVGNTTTTDLPSTPGAFLEKGTGAFVAKVNAAGTGLVYLTLVSATRNNSYGVSIPANSASSLAVDNAGNAYLVGSTSDPGFPSTPGVYQRTFTGTVNPLADSPPPSDAFVAKLNPVGSAMVWATYIGGKDVDSAKRVVVDGSGNIWVVGTTASADFPNAQGWSQGADFVVGLNATGTSLPYAARYPADTVAWTIGLDPTGMLHVAGSTGMVSTIKPAQEPTPRIFGVANAAWGTASGHSVPGEVILIYGPHIGPPIPATATPDSSGAFPTSLGGVQIVGDGLAFPLIYVSDSLIIAVTPYPSGITEIHTESNGISGPSFGVVDGIDPQVFQNADGSAKAVNQDGTINSFDQPAKSGSIMSIWATGLAMYPYPFPNCQVYLGETQPLAVSYCGQLPASVNSAVQINFQVPAESFDEYFITLSSGGRLSHPVRVFIKP